MRKCRSKVRIETPHSFARAEADHLVQGGTGFQSVPGRPVRAHRSLTAQYRPGAGGAGRFQRFNVVTLQQAIFTRVSGRADGPEPPPESGGAGGWRQRTSR